MIRPWPSHHTPTRSQRLPVRLRRRILIWKIPHFVLKSSAPATKRNIATSQNTAPATKVTLHRHQSFLSVTLSFCHFFFLWCYFSFLIVMLFKSRWRRCFSTNLPLIKCVCLFVKVNKDQKAPAGKNDFQSPGRYPTVMSIFGMQFYPSKQVTKASLQLNNALSSRISSDRYGNASRLTRLTVRVRKSSNCTFTYFFLCPCCNPYLVKLRECAS